MLELHLALAFLDVVQGRREHQGGTGHVQVQAKGNLLGARDIDGAALWGKGRGLGGNESPAASARHEAIGVGARLGDGLFGDVVRELSLLFRTSREFVKFGLSALAHAAERLELTSLSRCRRWVRRVPSC